MVGYFYLYNFTTSDLYHKDHEIKKTHSVGQASLNFIFYISSLKITSRIFKKLVVYPIQKHVTLNFYQKICVNFFKAPHEGEKF